MSLLRLDLPPPPYAAAIFLSPPLACAAMLLSLLYRRHFVAYFAFRRHFHTTIQRIMALIPRSTPFLRRHAASSASIVISLLFVEHMILLATCHAIITHTYTYIDIAAAIAAFAELMPAPLFQCLPRRRRNIIRMRDGAKKIWRAMQHRSLSHGAPQKAPLYARVK